MRWRALEIITAVALIGAVGTSFLFWHPLPVVSFLAGFALTYAICSVSNRLRVKRGEPTDPTRETPAGTWRVEKEPTPPHLEGDPAFKGHVVWKTTEPEKRPSKENPK